jgi:hypothetical protein
MSCLPCDSAVEYVCPTDDCDWCYTHGLNKRNPRWEREQTFRPQWLPEELPVENPRSGYGAVTWTHPEVSSWF